MDGQYEISADKVGSKWEYRIKKLMLVGVFGLISVFISVWIMNQLGVKLNKDNSGSIIILVTGIVVLQTMFLNVIKNYYLYVDLKKILEERETACWDMFRRDYENYCRQEVRTTPDDSGEYIDVDHKTFVEKFMSQSLYKGRLVINHIRGMKSIPSTLIVLGVLGTFIGLVIGLKEINVETLVSAMSSSADGVANTNTSEVFNSLLKMIGGIHTAFLTSIMGIISSIIVQLVMGRWNCEQVLTQVMLKFEMKLDLRKKDYGTKITVDELRKININLVNVQDGLMALENLKEATVGLNACNDKIKGIINGLDTSLVDHDKVSRFMAQSILKISGQFEGLNERLEASEKSTNNLASSMEKILGAINKMVEVQEQFEHNMGEELKDSFESQLGGLERSLDQIFEKQSIKTTEVIRTLEETLKEVSKGQLQTCGEINENFGKMATLVYEQMIDLPKQFSQTNIEAIKYLEAKEIYTDQQSKLIQEKLEQVIKNEQYAKEEWNQIMQSQKNNMEELIEKIEDAMKKFSGELEVSNKNIINYMDNKLDKIGNKITYNTSKFDTEMRKTFDNTLQFMELANEILKRKHEDFEAIQKSYYTPQRIK